MDATTAAKERAEQLIGRTLSERYRIVELIAMGGMGAVYRGEHLTMRKNIAIKVLHPEIEDFPEMVARFEREAVAGAHVQHPNVATASDFGSFDGESRFLVLELVDGITLRQLIDRGPVPPARACRIARHVAAGLAAVHDKGIVHRDIKPQNIMLLDKSRESTQLRVSNPNDVDSVKLIDFGLAKVPVEELSPLAQDADSPQSALTRAGMVVGTMGYLAPEAALGTANITAQSDLYALGVILYQMLCGKPPFEGRSPAEVFALHRTSPVPRIRERNPAVRVPENVEAIVRRLLEKNPADRYASADELVAALDEAMAGLREEAAAGSAVPRFSAPAQPPAPPERRRRPWLAAVAVVPLGVAGVLLYTQSDHLLGAPSPEGPSTAASAAAPPATAAASGRPAPPPALERLRQAADGGDPRGALALLVELSEKEPAAFADRAMQSEAASAIESATLNGIATDAIFERLTNQLGTDGIDILYDLMVRAQRVSDPPSRNVLAPPSTAGGRARALLADEQVRNAGSPSLRIAYDLLTTPCLQRGPLFARAAQDGDDRALEILRSMQRPACVTSGCCLEPRRELERTITDIQARLRH